MKHNEVSIPNQLLKTYITARNPQVSNVDFAPQIVAIQDELTENPVIIPPYSVVSLQWNTVQGFWKMDETQGIIASDSSGNGKNGTLQGGCTWTTNGKIGGAVNLDGVTGSVSIPNIINPSGGNYTAAMWVKLHQARGTTQTILQQLGSNGSTWLYRESSSGKLGSRSLKSNNAIPIHAWCHVALTDDGTKLSLYINGILNGTMARPTILSETGDMQIGKNRYPNTDNEEWDGMIDNVITYNRVLSDSEILNLYNSN